MTTLRHQTVRASEPGAEPACRLTREEGLRRRADTDRLFAALAEQRQVRDANEFIFRGDSDELWRQVSVFVEEEAQCCPFFTFEINERPDGVTLLVAAPPAPVTTP